MTFKFINRQQTLDDNPNYLSFQLYDGNNKLAIFTFTTEGAPQSSQACKLVYKCAREGFPKLTGRASKENLKEFLKGIGVNLRRHYQDTHQLETTHGTSLLAIYTCERFSYLAQIGNPIVISIDENNIIEPLSQKPSESPDTFNGNSLPEPYIFDIADISTRNIIIGNPVLFSLLGEAEFLSCNKAHDIEATVEKLNQMLVETETRVPYSITGVSFDLDPAAVVKESTEIPSSPESEVSTPHADVFQPIKDIVNKTQSIYWWYGGAILLLILLLFWIFKGRNEDSFIQTNRLETEKAKIEKYAPQIPSVKSAIHETATVKWRKSIPRSAVTTNALVFMDKVYFALKDKTFRCLNAATGDSIWIYQTDADIQSGPILYNNQIITGDEKGRLHFINPETGIADDILIIGAGKLSQKLTLNDDKLYIGCNDTYAYCIDLKKKEQLWRFKTDGIILDGVTIAANRIFIASMDHNIYCLDVATGQMYWQKNLRAALRGAPNVIEGTVYQGSTLGIMHAVNMDTGDVLWEFNVPRNDKESVSENKSIDNRPIVTESKIIFGSRDGALYCLDRISGNQIWRFSTPKAIMAAPAYYMGVIYFTSYDGYVYAVDESSGHLIWKLDLFLGSYNQPVIVDNNLYLGNIGGHFYAIELIKKD